MSAFRSAVTRDIGLTYGSSIQKRSCAFPLARAMTQSPNYKNVPALRRDARRDAEEARTDEPFDSLRSLRTGYGWRERGGRAAAAEPGWWSDERFRGVMSQDEPKARKE